MKRRWFQIHLSTAIVMMFVAGLLLYRGRWFIVDFVLTFQPEYSERFDERFRYSDRLSDSLYFVEVIVIVAAVAFFLEWRIRRRESRTK